MSKEAEMTIAAIRLDTLAEMAEKFDKERIVNEILEIARNLRQSAKEEK